MKFPGPTRQKRAKRLRLPVTILDEVTLIPISGNPNGQADLNWRKSFSCRLPVLRGSVCGPGRRSKTPGFSHAGFVGGRDGDIAKREIGSGHSGRLLGDFTSQNPASVPSLKILKSGVGFTISFF